MDENTKENIDIVIAFTVSIVIGLAFIILGQKYGFIVKAS